MYVSTHANDRTVTVKNDLCIKACHLHIWTLSDAVGINTWQFLQREAMGNSNIDTRDGIA